MDLERLTKHQIILLALLVSFVSSVATGIVTVSLMNQAPPSVSRTINEIVEHTVQTVTQPAATVAQATAPPTVKTVVVNNDDVAAQSIANVQKGIIRIVAKGDDTLIARGVIIASDGSALTDREALDASGSSSFEAILADGERVPLTIPKDHSTSTPVLAITVAVGTSTGFAPATLGDSSKLQLGQSIIRISGEGSDIVGEGVIAELPVKNNDTIETSVSSSMPGSLIMTLFGDVVGLSTTDSEDVDSAAYTLLSAPQPAATSTPATKSS